jgi:hypothetical protein
MEPATRPAALDSGDALYQLLKADLDYCPCAYTDAVPFLHELLRRIAARAAAVYDADAFSRRTAELEAWMLEHASGGVASWIVYGFERAGLLYHGWNVFDLSLTEKGRRVLAALDRFPDPQPAPSPVDDGDPDPALSS